MRRSTRTLALSVAALAAVGGATAGGALAHAGHHHTQKVDLRFAAMAGSTPVSCGNPITGLGTMNTTAQLQDFRFYISNVRLVRANGSSVPLTLTGDKDYNLTRGGNRTTLIDLENGKGLCTEGDTATNAAITGTVPEGSYVGVRMYLGVPFPLNHTDITTAPAPLDLTAMDWSWQFGRKFAKIEVVDPEGGGGGGMMMETGRQRASAWMSKAFMVHLGSTGCTGNPASGATVNCLQSNRVSVPLVKFNPARQRIAVDVKALLAGNDITMNRAGAPGCMSGQTDPECAGVFSALQLGWKADGTGSGQPIDRGLKQTVFRAIPR
jgi:uncharacterized repeat protein (TIGR04052 family)